MVKNILSFAHTLPHNNTRPCKDLVTILLRVLLPIIYVICVGLLVYWSVTLYSMCVRT